MMNGRGDLQLGAASVAADLVARVVGPRPRRPLTTPLLPRRLPITLPLLLHAQQPRRTTALAARELVQLVQHWAVVGRSEQRRALPH